MHFFRMGLFSNIMPLAQQVMGSISGQQGGGCGQQGGEGGQQGDFVILWPVLKMIKIYIFGGSIRYFLSITLNLLKFYQL